MFTEQLLRSRHILGTGETALSKTPACKDLLTVQGQVVSKYILFGVMKCDEAKAR